MKQTSMQLFESGCGKIKLYVSNDTSLGALHDYHVLIKGNIVKRRIANQKEK